MFISLHYADLGNVLSDHNHYAGLIEDGLKNISTGPHNLGTLAMKALSFAGYQAVIDPNSVDLYRALRIAAYSLTQVCELANLPPGNYEVFVGEGYPVMLPSGTNSYSSGISWLQAFYLALCCRESNLLNSLANISVDVLKRSSTQNDDYLYLQIEALQSYWQNTRDTPIKIVRAMKATDPDLIRLGSLSTVLNISIPEIDLLYRLIENDKNAFNYALNKALEHHKRFWGTEQFKNHPEGFIAVGILGLVSIAHSKGINIEVESDYLPKYIYQAEFLK